MKGFVMSLTVGISNFVRNKVRGSIPMKVERLDWELVRGWVDNAKIEKKFVQIVQLPPANFGLKIEIDDPNVRLIDNYALSESLGFTKLGIDVRVLADNTRSRTIPNFSYFEDLLPGNIISFWWQENSLTPMADVYSPDPLKIPVQYRFPIENVYCCVGWK